MKSCIIKRSFTFKSLAPSLIAFAIGFVIACLALKFLYALSVISLAAGLIIAVIIIPANIFTEYEYNLEGETFSVALIRNKSSRKELFGCDIAHLITCEPYLNQPLGGIKLDYSEKVNTTYFAVFNEEGKQAAVIFSADEAFVRELFLMAPGKVKRI